MLFNIYLSRLQEVFGWYNKILRIAGDIVERMEECTEIELINAMYDTLIYEDDLWIIMNHYQKAREANLNKALEQFYNDLTIVLRLQERR